MSYSYTKKRKLIKKFKKQYGDKWLGKYLDLKNVGFNKVHFFIH